MEASSVPDHQEATRKALAWLRVNERAGLGTLEGAGHRVVHGGDRFPGSVLIDGNVVAAIEALSDLAPLHNPACLSGIRTARASFGPDFPMVAVFDTAFHQTLPPHAAVYAIPYEMSMTHRIRRYGFHGIAHQYMTLRYAEIVQNRPEDVTIITLQLGNGCSVTAIRNGRSVDTSMGFTPLEGLVMGTRSGDLDPGVVAYLTRKEELSAAEVENVLNERSGLLGVSGRARDMRELIKYAREDVRAQLAIDLFCYRVRKYIGAYLVALGGVEAIVFSGGIGENSPLVRAKICEGLEWCGLELDSTRNAAILGAEGQISLPQARIHAYVIPSDEEMLIAQDTARLIETQRLEKK